MFMMFPLLLPPRVSVIKSLGTMFFPIEQELVSGKQHGQPSANEKMKALCSLLLKSRPRRAVHVANAKQQLLNSSRLATEITS